MTTKLETTTATVWCKGNKMALYAKDKSNAWLSTTHAINLRQYR